jgi:hypothetical protein
VSALSALEVTVAGIGQFLSPYLRDLIQTVVPIPDHYPTPQVLHEEKREKKKKLS